MTITDRTRQAVDRLLADLRERYDAFDPVEKAWEHDPAAYRSVVARFEAGSQGGAGVWVTNAAGEVLLARNEGDAGWGDPGGKAEPGESVEETARREVREETGLDCRLTGLCDVHVIENRCVTGDEPPVFDAVVVVFGELVHGASASGPTPVPRTPAGEVAAAAWFADPPDAVLYEEIRSYPFPANE